MPISCSHHQSVFHKGLLYVMGGISNHSIMNNCYSYNLQSNEWTELATMNNCRSHFTAVSCGNHIYVCGGF
jgi:N-acetylneuraminic acid mutarotase